MLFSTCSEDEVSQESDAKQRAGLVPAIELRSVDRFMKDDGGKYAAHGKRDAEGGGCGCRSYGTVGPKHREPNNDDEP